MLSSTSHSILPLAEQIDQFTIAIPGLIPQQNIYNHFSLHNGYVIKKARHYYIYSFNFTLYFQQYVLHA